MPLLRHEEAKHRTIRQHHRNHGALRMDSQMPRMSERHLDQNTGRQHQNRDPRMEPIRQRRMAQTPGGNEMRINFNNKDGVFAIKAENEEEKTQLKNVGGRHLQSHHRFFRR